MTDMQYGYSSSPSSQPPEPPYRSNEPRPQHYAQHQAQPQVQQTQPVYQEAQQAPHQVTSTYQAQPTTKAQPTYQATAPRATQQKSGGGGKSFIFGFLGALVACALALGGFALWQGSSNKVATVMGTTDPSVINAVDEGETLAEAVAQKALPSVVAIYNYQNAQSGYYGYGYGGGSTASSEPQQAGMGSGVVISNDGYIITNYHVVEDAVKLTVTVDGVERDAEYVGGDSSSDIAVLKVSNTEGLVAADIGDSDSLKIGEWVMTIGAPLGLEQSVATGVVSATNRSTVMSNSSSDAYSYYYGTSSQDYAYYPNMIQTDALINPGNSGGALVDADGKLIGINSMLSSYSGDYAGVGFAIPINYAMGIAEDIMAGKEPTHAILGVSISQVNSQTAQRYNLSATSGAYIAGITPDTGAANSDLQVGDIITAINGKAVSSTTDVTLDVREHAVGDTVTVTVNRNGESLDIPVVLSSDENIAKSDSTQQNQQQMPQGNGYGNGNGYGGGNDGYSEEELEYLLRMLGM